MRNIHLGSNEYAGSFFCTITDIGTCRKTNQDSIYANLLSTSAGLAFLGIVCDGMGGLSYGEIASSKTVTFFSEWFEQEFRYIMSTDNLSESIQRQWNYIFESVQNELYSYVVKMGSNMGTTLSMLLLVGGKYYVLQIGDSRVYKINDNSVELITMDHSFVMDKVRNGLMTFDEACLSKEKSVLTRCIGGGEFFSADFYEGNLIGSDSFFLSSDGFHGGKTAEQMNEILMGFKGLNQRNAKKQLECVVEEKKAAGETDNISAIYVNFENKL